MQFKHHLGVELAGDKETVFLIGERERTMLRGRVGHLLGPLLDGRRTADELVAALDGHNRPVEVYLERRRGGRGPLLPPLVGLPAGRRAALGLVSIWIAAGGAGPLFLELVERDVVALWWYNRARRPAVDLKSFGDPYFDALEGHYRGLGWRLWVLDVTSDLGIPVVLDQMRPDTGLCAVKVAVPGLRHFWPRFGPGRLYDVPVRLGWLERANREEDLNPVPLVV
ncbi:YcaO-like family protein [Sorangium sp. So ce363]